jgi:5-methylthioadenosine/S-adenosylhomocysteine deaminase
LDPAVSRSDPALAPAPAAPTSALTSALTVLGAVDLDGRPTALRAEGGTIVDVGPHVAAHPGDEVLDADGSLLLPGLVNGHTHAAMTLLRGTGDGLPLMRWLRERIWPAEARLTEDDVYWGTRLACLEMVRSGTTHLVDMYWHGAAAARAAADAGLRITASAVLLDGGDDASDEPGAAARTAELVARAVDSLDELASLGPLVRPALGPHAVYTVGERSLRRVGELATDRAVPVHIHLSETRDEVEGCLDRHGVRPAVLLDRCGVLGPATIAAHGCWLDADELALVAERGATVVTNPVSNCKLAVGRSFPLPEARTTGVALGLGTDGAASNDGLDLLADAKVLALLQKHDAGDPGALTAAEALELATGTRSPALGGRGLVVGAPCDVVLVDLDAPQLVGGTDLATTLVYAGSGAVVDTVVVAGRVVMRHRAVPGAAEVVARAREHATRLRA